MVRPERNMVRYTPAATIMRAPIQPQPELKPLTDSLKPTTETPYHGRNMATNASTAEPATTLSNVDNFFMSNAAITPPRHGRDRTIRTHRRDPTPRAGGPCVGPTLSQPLSSTGARAAPGPHGAQIPEGRDGRRRGHGRHRPHRLARVPVGTRVDASPSFLPPHGHDDRRAVGSKALRDHRRGPNDEVTLSPDLAARRGTTVETCPQAS